MNNSKIEVCLTPLSHESYFPPPWNITDHPEKTEGWIEFQKTLRKDPKYYMEWIDVKEKYPKEYEDVLIYSPGFPPITAYLTCERDSPIWWFVRDWDKCENAIYWNVVTHWMPMPFPPTC